MTETFELNLTFHQEEQLRQLRQDIKVGVRLSDSDLKQYRYLAERQRKYRQQLINHLNN